VNGPDGKPVMQTVTQQRSRRDRRPRRRSSKSWEPTAAASSTRTARIRLRIPRRSRTFLEMFCILCDSLRIYFTLGKMTGSPRHGWAVWAAMALLFLAGVTTAYWAEARGNPLLTAAAQHSSQHSSSAGKPRATLKGKKCGSVWRTRRCLPP
jgi:potassium-transporting ATPase potassium-binding subunit